MTNEASQATPSAESSDEQTLHAWLSDFLMEGFTDDDYWREVMSDIATDLLDSHEMQAVRSLLRLTRRQHALGEAWDALPDTVKRWVMS